MSRKPRKQRLNKRIGPFLTAFYHFLKFIIRIGLRFYYRKYTIARPHRLKFDGPGIVVSNHPSTLMDPFNAVADIRRIMHFLINYGLVKSKAGNWFFNKFYCIPIKRASDVKRGEARNNADAFARSNRHLLEGGVLYIAVEGGSEPERRLRGTKSGAARIALAAEADADWQLGLRFLPVGLNYKAPLKFQQDALIEHGEPFEIGAYRERYEADPVRTIRELTADIDARLRACLIDTADDEIDAFLRTGEIILQNTEPLPPVGEYERTRRLHRSLIDLRRTPEPYDAWKTQAERYRNKLKKTGLTDEIVFAPDIRLWELCFLLFGLPLFLFGVVTHLFAFGLPYLIERLAGTDKSYRSTIRYLTGILLVPIFYLLNWFLFYWITGSSLLAWIFWLAMLPAAFFAWDYQLLARRVARKLKWLGMNAALRTELKRVRTELAAKFFGAC